VTSSNIWHLLLGKWITVTPGLENTLINMGPQLLEVLEDYHLLLHVAQGHCWTVAKSQVSGLDSITKNGSSEICDERSWLWSLIPRPLLEFISSFCRVGRLSVKMAPSSLWVCSCGTNASSAGGNGEGAVIGLWQSLGEQGRSGSGLESQVDMGGWEKGWRAPGNDYIPILYVLFRNLPSTD
jgi:hypothetical protein